MQKNRYSNAPGSIARGHEARSSEVLLSEMEPTLTCLGEESSVTLRLQAAHHIEATTKIVELLQEQRGCYGVSCRGFGFTSWHGEHAPHSSIWSAGSSVHESFKVILAGGPRLCPIESMQVDGSVPDYLALREA